MNGRRTDVLFLFCPASLVSGTPESGTFPQVRWWGGWGSNPRPADYESPTYRRGQ